MNEDWTITEIAHDEFEDWCERAGMLNKDHQLQLRYIFIEAWIRGFAYRMANGANNVRS